MAFELIRLKVRRLMYQSLIFAAIAGDDPGRLRSTFNAKDVDRLANSLIDRVRRYSEFASNLFRIQVLIDKPKAVELAACQALYSLLHQVARHVGRSPVVIRRAIGFLQSCPHPAQRTLLLSNESAKLLGDVGRLRQIDATLDATADCQPAREEVWRNRRESNIGKMYSAGNRP